MCSRYAWSDCLAPRGLQPEQGQQKRTAVGRSSRYLEIKWLSALSYYWKTSYTFGLLQFFLKINADAADHFPFIPIGFFQEAFFFPPTHSFPSWRSLVHARGCFCQNEVRELFLREKSWVESDFQKLMKKVACEKNPKPIKVAFCLIIFLNIGFISSWAGHFKVLNKCNYMYPSHPENISTKYWKILW